MRTSIKLVVTGVILIFLGAATCGVSAGFMGFNNNDLSTSDVVTNEYEIEDAFRDIQIKGDDEKIVLAKATDGKCKLVFDEYENKPHSYRIENDKLIIEKAEDRKFELNFSIGVSKGITLYIPEEQYGNIDIKTDSGRVDISGIMTEDLTFKGDSGLVSIKDVKCIDTMQLTVDSGAMNLEGIRCTDFSANGDSGILNLKDVIASRSMDIKRESGMVIFDECDAGSITVKTESGAIKGTLLTGKTFKVKAEHGIVKVPDDSGRGSCEIETESGLVQITLK